MADVNAQHGSGGGVGDDGAVLRVEDFALSFDNGSGRGGRGAGPRIRAVDGANLAVYPRQTVAVVGESGCGKSVTAMSVLGLVPRPPGRYDRGSIWFRSDAGREDLLAVGESRLRQIRGGEIAMIFQEPMTCLNPVFSVGEQLVEAIRLHRSVGGKEARAIAESALAEVGIPDPKARLAAYPHQFSGGMRQRAMIAMALACEPRLLLADEPTTALDVTIQKQILELLESLKDRHGMSVVLITHDLGVVAQHSDVVCVMYAGRAVEYARVDELFRRPLHPYTRGLLACIPKLDDSQTPGERLTTVAEVVNDAAEFRGFSVRAGREDLGTGATPWWPWHEPPPGCDDDRSVGLFEVHPEHWVALWRTEGVGSLDERAVCIRPGEASAVAPDGI